MAEYRKKPVVVEAVQNTPENMQDAVSPQWFKDAAMTGAVKWGDDRHSLRIHTLEGVIRADPGDWIIRGAQGELYPCRPDIFAATYEPVDDTPEPGTHEYAQWACDS